jgi:hypothetical protein
MSLPASEPERLSLFALFRSRVTALEVRARPSERGRGCRKRERERARGGPPLKEGDRLEVEEGPQKKG